MLATITVIIQLIFLYYSWQFIRKKIYNKNMTQRHNVNLISGFLLTFIFFTPFHEFNLTGNSDSTTGMLLVGIISLILLIWWRNKVLKSG